MRILFATDGSTHAHQAAHLLSRLKLNAEDQIRILTVGSALESEADTDLLQDARKDFAHCAATVDTQARQGYADEEILKECQQWPAELLVVGAKGASNFKRFLLGRVAGRMLRHAPCSVLLVRPEKTALRRILVGFDDSESSRAATRHLVSFPLNKDAEVELVSVLPPLDPHAPQRREATFPSGVTELKVMDDLFAYHRQLLAVGRKSSTHILRGDPANELLSDAAERDVDLVVMGSHGSSLSERFHRFLLGSVSEKVARYAHCSVLIVRQPGE